MKPRTSHERPRAVRLGRHEVDRIARAIAGGQRGLGTRLDAIADAIAARMTAKLAAAGVPVDRPTRRGAEVALDRETRSLIVARVSKHLPTVDQPSGDGSARAR